MTEWKTVKLGELAADESGAISIGPFGSRMKTSTYVEYGVPVIRGTNISDTKGWKGDWVYVSAETADSMLSCNVRADDLVFPHRGSIGEVAIIPNDLPRYMLSTSLMKFTPDKEKADPLFLFYYFRTQVGRNEILRFASQVGTPGIGQPITSLKLFRVTLPATITEQRQIASVLSALDDKIELNRDMNKTLEAMARAIFKDWFINFGPVRAKAEGQSPYLASELWDLFPNKLDNEGKPLGWSVRSIGDVMELNPTEKLSKGVDAPYLDMAALPVRGASPDNPIQRSVSSGSRFRNGDTLLARITPCLENGKTAYITCLNEAEIGWGSTEFIVMRTKPPLPPEYGYLLARDEAFRTYAIQSMTGTSGRQRAQLDVIKKYEVFYPNENVAKAFGQIIAPWFELISKNAEELQTLTQMRELLLPRLISGQIRIKTAKDTLGGVL